MIPGSVKFSQDLFDRICDRIADGESLRDICKESDKPNKGTFFRWIANDPKLCDQYAKAREAQAEFMADEILNIADDGSNDWIFQNGDDEAREKYKLNGEAIARSRLRVDARKWVASKLLPKKYGDKIDHSLSGPGGGPIETVNRIELVAAEVSHDDSQA